MHTDSNGKCDIYANAYRESVSDRHDYAQCYADGYTAAPSNAQAAANTISPADSVTVAGMN